MQNLLEDLKKILSANDRLVVDGKLMKNKIIELGLALDKGLLTLLLKNPTIKKHFFEDVSGTLVFDKIKFMRFVSNKEFLPDSYTSFKNKIGLTVDDEFISEGKEIILAFPYKDCVLEGGQTTEESKRLEIFWNQILAPDDIDRILSPKAISSFKKYTSDGNEEIKEFSPKDNLIIKGNNLLALHTIRKRYSSKVKLIYIDPPYNTGNDGFKYNDSFNHSTWLTFMKNRLEVARELLTSDGSIWINIDDNEVHYLKVLCDEIFGRENFLINFIWQKKYSPSNDAKWFSDNHDHILVFAKNKELFKPNLLARTEEMNKRYSNPDNDPRGDWKPGGYSVKTYSKEYDYPIETPSGKIVYPPKGSCWQTSETNFKKMLAEKRIWFGAKGDAKPQIKQFLSEVQQGTVTKSIWLYDEVGHNQISRAEIIKLFGEHAFATPKPEKLIKRIIDLSTKEDDIVLDFFLGSGTTTAVAHKMKRRYVGIDQMDYIETVAVNRMKKVIEGEDGGVSKEVFWEGGGSFIFCELAKQNQKFTDRILNEKSKDKIIEVVEEMAKSFSISYRYDKLYTDFKNIKLSELKLEDLRKLAMNIIEYNQLYVNYSEIEDNDYGYEKKLIELNNKFQNSKL